MIPEDGIFRSVLMGCINRFIAKKLERTLSLSRMHASATSLPSAFLKFSLSSAFLLLRLHHRAFFIPRADKTWIQANIDTFLLNFGALICATAIRESDSIIFFPYESARSLQIFAIASTVSMKMK
ncbi:unnamed protein product [Albugo candida]|uniref:Uncharacterized protein n=1 Tax=Albugo candida TaxID=65357 RepID=A0A024FX40_9STRA|nr:unnamed protein product [Albugo candida]|eukprot:CCI11229.1 unnamed protein product [Albugo candida]